MATGGTTGYASINARVRVMYSTLLTPQEVSRLVEAPDLNTLLTLLKPTVYGPYLEKVKDKDLSARRAAFQIRGRLADAYTSIIHGAPEHTRTLLTQRYRYFEVENLKAVLRGIVSGNTWDTVRFVLFPFGSETTIPAQQMVESGQRHRRRRAAARHPLLRNALLRDQALQRRTEYLPAGSRPGPELLARSLERRAPAAGRRTAYRPSKSLASWST